VALAIMMHAAGSSNILCVKISSFFIIQKTAKVQRLIEEGEYECRQGESGQRIEQISTFTA
jgi:hypothetical protein